MDPELSSLSDLILVFDAGTRSIRCTFFDRQGLFVDFKKKTILPYFNPEPKFYDQQPNTACRNFAKPVSIANIRKVVLRIPQKVVEILKTCWT